MYIQWFCTLMDKILAMTHEEAFLLFMRRLEPKIQEKIRFHVQGDLGLAMLMVEKVHVWRAKVKGEKMGQKSQKYGGNGLGK